MVSENPVFEGRIRLSGAYTKYAARAAANSPPKKSMRKLIHLREGDRVKRGLHTEFGRSLPVHVVIGPAGSRVFINSLIRLLAECYLRSICSNRY
jgi:hypothetical protein